MDKRFFECQENFCKPLCETECKLPSDCNVKDWPTDAQCAETDGHWECNLGFCVTVCDGCSEASDCEASNPEFPKCCDGHWECNETICDAVCDLGCETRLDCTGQPWPEFLECTEPEGNWECVGCECEASCISVHFCDDVSDCFAFKRDEDCEGHWACEAEQCNARCGETCGDGECKAGDGEDLETCPADCGPPCSDESDCVERAWGLACQGRFKCSDGDCLRVCDYASCGNETCDDSESTSSCPDDCRQGCEKPSDCLGDTWTRLCGGSYSCISGQCRQVCDPALCGNGVCDSTGLSAESGLSCGSDCGEGPCDTASECNAYFWSGGCPGHWDCVDENRCDTVCDEVGCSDGTCDILGGESPFSCAADCAAYQCLTDDGCSGLTLPAGCIGSYRCFERVCVPRCD